MIVGRIAETASVQVNQAYGSEISSAMSAHLTSVVKGRLLQELTAMDAWKRLFRQEQVSGAPKIRVMKRIYELETEKRGVYVIIGYLSATEGHGLAIVIRTTT